MQRPRTPSRISESLHQRLNSYALAASAAGVSVLALAQPVTARVVYTPTELAIGPHGTYQLDLNHDQKVDFIINDRKFHLTSGGAASLFASGVAGNAVAAGAGKYYFLGSALKRGGRISKSRTFAGKAMMVFFCSGSGCYPYSSRTSGNWINVTNRYLGLKFKIQGKTHYGWARLSVQFVRFVTLSTTLTGYAYETIPNKPIIAGKTNGKDVITLQDASLGHLARGASVIPAWPRKVAAAR